MYDWRRKLTAATTIADENAPYFAEARASMEIIEAADCPTMGVDKHWRLYVNPEFVKERSLNDLAYVLIHETCHLVRDHSDRAKVMGITAVNHNCWNAAADAEINQFTFGILKPPADCVTPQSQNWPINKTAEEYYRMIPVKDSAPQPQAGSGSDGLDKGWELPAPSDGISDMEKDVIRTQAADKLRDAIGKGNAPAGLDVWCDTIKGGKVNWQSVLAHLLCQSRSMTGLGHQTYRRTRKRGSLYFPRHCSKLPVLAVVCDTSGSMYGKRLQDALGEVTRITRRFGATNIIWCDTNPIIQRNVTAASSLTPKGGGGTDMIAGIEFCDKLTGRDKPDCIIVITDTETSWPRRPPKADLIVCAVGSYYNPPPFGRVVKVENN